MDNKKVEEIEVNTPSKKSWKRKRGSEIFFKIKKMKLWKSGRHGKKRRNRKKVKRKKTSRL